MIKAIALTLIVVIIILGLLGVAITSSMGRAEEASASATKTQESQNDACMTLMHNAMIATSHPAYTPMPVNTRDCTWR